MTLMKGVQGVIISSSQFEGLVRCGVRHATVVNRVLRLGLWRVPLAALGDL